MSDVSYVRTGGKSPLPLPVIMHAGGWSGHDRHVRSSRTSPDDLREWRNPMPKFGLRVRTSAATELWLRFAETGYTTMNMTMDDRILRGDIPHYKSTSTRP